MPFGIPRNPPRTFRGQNMDQRTFGGYTYDPRDRGWSHGAPIRDQVGSGFGQNWDISQQEHRNRQATYDQRRRQEEAERSQQLSRSSSSSPASNRQLPQLTREAVMRLLREKRGYLDLHNRNLQGIDL